MTARQRQIADFIDRYWVENWTSPTVREIKSELGLSSTETVARHLERMVRDGNLERKQLSSLRVLYRTLRSDRG